MYGATTISKFQSKHCEKKTKPNRKVALGEILNCGYLLDQSPSESAVGNMFECNQQG